MRGRLFIAINAILDAVKHYLFTIFLVPVIGLLTYKKMEGVGLFIAGAFSGYLQGFFEECLRNYKRRAAAEIKTPPTEISAASPRPERIPAKRKRRSWLPGIQKIALVVLKGSLRAGAILLAGLLLWNLILFIFYR